MIYLNDHAPAHVHAVHPDGEAKIELASADSPPRLAWVRGRMTDAEVRRALAEVAREQGMMWNAWRRIHEGDAP